MYFSLLYPLLKNLINPFMKLVFTFLFSGSLLIFSNLKAQENALVINDEASTTNYSAFKKNAVALNASEVKANALHDFTSKFKNASDAQWVSSGKTVSVYFTEANCKMRSTYDEKGNWEYTLRY